MLKILRKKNGEKNEIGDEMEDEEIRIRGGKQEIEREKKKQKRKRRLKLKYFQNMIR